MPDDASVPDKPCIDHLAPGIRQVLRCLLDGKAARLQSWFPLKTVEKLLDWWRNLPPHLSRISPFSLICGDFFEPYGPTMASRVIAAQAEHLPISQGGTVIDLMSGFGGPARFLARQYGCRIHCVESDADKVAIANALNRLEELDHLITTDGVATGPLQIEAESAACVWGHSWGLKEAYKPLLAEAYRILTPGGTLVNFCRSSYVPLFSQLGFSVITAHTYFHDLLKKAHGEYAGCLRDLRSFVAVEFGEKTLKAWDMDIKMRSTQAANYNDYDWVLVEARK